MHRRSTSFVLVVLSLLIGRIAYAQARVGSDSATRLTHFGRSVVYGTAEGLAFSGIDQWRDNPESWGDSWNGYGKRAASNVGEFLIQEGVTEGLAALMNRPVMYRRCHCGGTSKRIWWAVEGAFTDQMANGTHPIAIPRIVGAYAGSFAQASWRPADGSRTQTALVNGTVSLGIGALINLFYEFK